jgi:hypothetical protein
LPTVPAALRPKVSALSEPAVVEKRLTDAIDRALDAEAAEFRVPTSVVWSVIGVGQYIITGVLIFAAIWIGALFLLDKPPTGSFDVPVLGPVPAPVVLLAVTLAVGYLLAIALRVHAGWLGRRWARKVAKHITVDVNARIRDTVLLPLEELDAARLQLARALRTMKDGCA